MQKRTVLASLATLALTAGLALAAPSVHEVNALGQYDQTTGSINSGSDKELIYYYQPAALGLSGEAPNAFSNSVSVSNFVITGITGDSGFTPTLDSASIVNGQNGQPLVKLAIDIATTAGTGSHDLTILAKNTSTGESFELPVNVWVQ
ncbi:MAG TPA: hypothetical protein VHN99_09775 [Deinococcales bacterium]|nr:hypothetical protein [Deinococcales bacterium]